MRCFAETKNERLRTFSLKPVYARTPAQKNRVPFPSAEEGIAEFSGVPAGESRTECFNEAVKNPD